MRTLSARSSSTSQQAFKHDPCAYIVRLTHSRSAGRILEHKLPKNIGSASVLFSRSIAYPICLPSHPRISWNFNRPSHQSVSQNLTRPYRSWTKTTQIYLIHGTAFPSRRLYAQQSHSSIQSHSFPPTSHSFTPVISSSKRTKPTNANAWTK